MNEVPVLNQEDSDSQSTRQHNVMMTTSSGLVFLA
jgi:hypothetical protein